jgi:formamidopyrimidine-DNA glycosylase
VELPEAYAIAKQMNNEIVGKEVSEYNLKDCEKFQKLGFINIYQSDFKRLIGHKIQAVNSRGNTIHVKLESELNLLLAPEYGGKILYQQDKNMTQIKFHLKISFTDSSSFTVTLTGMGIIKALTNDELKKDYMYKRDFSATLSPLDDKSFTLENFSKQLSNKKVNIKTALVGKDAVLVGVGNSLFQDIIYRAQINPKTKASELDKQKVQALFFAVKLVIAERVRLGGKNQFVDFYGKQGSYIPAMGPNMKGKNCLACGTEVQKLALGGGQIFYCPHCQAK